MKFNTAIANLKEMGFVNDRDKIHIAVNRNKSLAHEDRLFDCILPAEQAEHFFGDTEIIKNDIRNKSDGNHTYPEFFFLLSYESVKE